MRGVELLPSIPVILISVCDMVNILLGKSKKRKIENNPEDFYVGVKLIKRSDIIEEMGTSFF